ncbi:hypothetical protein FACS1894187_06250 [Synergistales bacterium]|nr:hypothetical protein FACS1894187_06250 [Synergistales bacterium]
MAIETKRRSNIPVRLPEQMAREFKSACALEGVTAQSVLFKAVSDFLEERKKKAE